MKYFDPSVPAFYCSEINTNIPETALRISEETYNILRSVINDTTKAIKVNGDIITIEEVVREPLPLSRFNDMVDTTISSAMYEYTVIEYKGVPATTWYNASSECKASIAGAFNTSVQVIEDHFNNKNLELSTLANKLQVARTLLEGVIASEPDVDLRRTLSNFEHEVKLICSEQSEQ